MKNHMVFDKLDNNYFLLVKIMVWTWKRKQWPQNVCFIKIMMDVSNWPSCYLPIRIILIMIIIIIIIITIMMRNKYVRKNIFLTKVEHKVHMDKSIISNETVEINQNKKLKTKQKIDRKSE